MLSASGFTTKRRAPSGLVTIDAECVWCASCGGEEEDPQPKRRTTAADAGKRLKRVMA
jgi:hypothetical protein